MISNDWPWHYQPLTVDDPVDLEEIRQMAAAAGFNEPTTNGKTTENDPPENGHEQVSLPNVEESTI